MLIYHEEEFRFESRGLRSAPCSNHVRCDAYHKHEALNVFKRPQRCFLHVPDILETFEGKKNFKSF